MELRENLLGRRGWKLSQYTGQHC